MSGQEILIEQLRAEVERLTAERDAAFEQGRIVGRADVAKYARAIGEIESVVGIVGAVPMPQTVQAVRDLVSRAEKAEREFADRLDHLTAAVKRGDVLQARVTELEKRLAASRAIVDDLKSTIRREEVRGDTAIRERDEARAERDARPDISAEDAALVWDVSGLVAVSRVYRVLMVHAAKAVKP